MKKLLDHIDGRLRQLRHDTSRQISGVKLPRLRGLEGLPGDQTERFPGLIDEQPDAPRSEDKFMGRWQFVAFSQGVFICALALLYTLQGVLWTSEGTVPFSAWQQLAQLGSWAWAAPLASALFGVLGLLAYNPPPKENAHPIQQRVVFRIVSRGQNWQALADTMRRVHEIMSLNPLFAYDVEAVTDLDLPDIDVSYRHLRVPDTYVTTHSARFKARALQYAITHSPAAASDWVMMLDEESQITVSLVNGIARAVAEEETSGQHRIGQGTILYNRQFSIHYLLTLADMMRTGDDLGRFSCQYRLIGRTFFGMHGSFILARTSVLKSVGFDFGLKGSITEDAWWALLQMEQGKQARWVDGYVVEQSCATVKDFIKQRKRWLVGLVQVFRFAPTARRWRLPLAIGVMGWMLHPFGVFYTAFNFTTGLYVTDTAQLLGNIVFAHYLSVYVIGLKINLDNYGPIKRWQRALAYVLVVVLLPMFAIWEAIGALAAILKPEMTFHVIKKGVRGQGGQSDAGVIVSDDVAVMIAGREISLQVTSPDDSQSLLKMPEELDVVDDPDIPLLFPGAQYPVQMRGPLKAAAARAVKSETARGHVLINVDSHVAVLVQLQMASEVGLAGWAMLRAVALVDLQGPDSSGRSLFRPLIALDVSTEHSERGRAALAARLRMNQAWAASSIPSQYRATSFTSLSAPAAAASMLLAAQHVHAVTGSELQAVVHAWREGDITQALDATAKLLSQLQPPEKNTLNLLPGPLRDAMSSWLAR